MTPRYLVAVTPGSVLPTLRGRRSILERHAPIALTSDLAAPDAGGAQRTRLRAAAGQESIDAEDH